MNIQEVREKLMAYRALDNPYRLKAFSEIARNPGIYFNDLAKRIGIERGLLAYHVGVLHAAELIERTLERSSKKISKYKITEKGEKVLRELSRGKKSKNKAGEVTSSSEVDT
jgi:predicted transcriptional regulator